MDRSLTESLRKIAQTLTVLSQEYEPFVPSQTAHLGSDLSLLGSLEKMTRKSIEEVIKASKASKAAAAPPPSLKKTSESMPARFDSKHPEYRQALKDPSLVQALLKLAQEAHAPSNKTAVNSMSTQAKPRSGFPKK